MTKYLGDFAAGVSVRGTFQTRAKATGAPITLAGSPALAVYKDGNATETTTGVALTVDFDSRTGHHLYAITTTDAFYSTGSDYRIVLTAGTVDGESQVGVEVGSFSIENRFAPSGSGLDAAGVRAAVGLAAANLDTQLGDLPTNAEFELRTLPSADYFVVGNYTAPPSAAQNASQVRTELATELARIDATISSRSTFAGGAVASVTGAVGSVTAPVTVGTNNDKTGYALTQAFPSNFASLGINSSGYISRVVLVDTTTANSDMRGTDGALLASNYTAPANGDIAAIKAKTDNLPNDPATIAKQDEILGAIDGIDCGGGGGLTGDFTLTVTVTDADTSQPIENATVTLSRTGERGAELTDVNGVAVVGLDAATWSWVVRAAGYESRTGVVVVSGDQALAVEMDGIVATVPSSPDSSALTVLCLDELGEPEPGVDIDIRIVTVPSGDTNTAYKGSKQTAVSNSSGIASLQAIKGAVYEYKRGKAEIWNRVTIGSGATTNVSSFIGSP